mgnify:CR=1 FL=1
MINEAQLIWGVVFGAIGFGYFIYGKKQKAPVAFFAGLGLFIFPYFVEGTAALIIIGALLMAAPFIIKL